MKRIVIFTTITSAILSKEVRFPKPDEDTCAVINKEDYRGQIPKCRGFGCPPCWTFKESFGWVCIAKNFGECEGRAAIDIEIYDVELERMKRLAQSDGRGSKTLDITYL